MFCTNCGKEIDDKAVICIHCGCATAAAKEEKIPNKSMVCAVLLYVFFGLIGAHRFYLKDTSAGIIMIILLCTFWLVVPAIILGFWLLIDFFRLISGNLQPKDGSKLV